MQAIIDEIKQLSALNYTNLQTNSNKINALRDDLTKAEEARLLQEECWKLRDEQWKTFCQEQENNFKRYIDSITSGQGK